jgi:hypothetical protein
MANMGLARAWARQLYGASGAALLAPGAIVLALALLGFAGGFGQLGALGQAFTGPSVPAGGSLTATSFGPGHEKIAGPPLVRAATTAAGVAASAAGPARRATTHRIGTGTRTSAGTETVSSGPASGSTGTRTGSGFTGGKPTGGGSGSGGGTPPSLVNSVIKVGTGVTKQVPGPVGGAATQVLNSVGKGLDSVVPPAIKNSGGLGSVTSALHLP